jgi:hypothetical protein
MAEERVLSLKQLAAEINRTYQQIIDGEKKSIEYATEIGEMLIAAKKQHGEHGKWLNWLKAECPQIAETTATLYMRIAKRGDELATAAEANQQRVADLTIRGAARLLAKPKDETAPRSPRPRNPKAAVEPPEPPAQGASPDLPTLIKNVGADEVALAIRQADWAMEEIRKLISMLTVRMQSLGTQAPPLRPQPSASPSVRPS